MRALLPVLLIATNAPCPAQQACAPCGTPEEAKAIAESETLGEAVTALRVIQSDGTKGWSVLVHVPGAENGWRCLIDWDTAKLRWKESIKNPPSKTCGSCGKRM